MPIDTVLPAVLDAFVRRVPMVLEAPPGAGKTTRLPRALVEDGLVSAAEGTPGMLWVLEPRRLAARWSAIRIAQELETEVGDLVGYATRFDRALSARTRVQFVTEGVFLRRLASSPTLKGVAGVLLDEFHERHLASDVALATLQMLRATSRPDLWLGVMSATMDGAAVAAFLNAEHIVAKGKTFPIDVDYRPPADRPLDRAVTSAIKEVHRAQPDGHVLVFLPGAREIRACQRALQSFAADEAFKVLPLHGSLTAREQDAVLAPSDVTKVILSTNVAETSVTIEGVVAVVDSGLSNFAEFDPTAGLQTLRTKKIARGSADQRTGRAGRTRPGRCLRLFERSDFERRPAYEVPEIGRADLSELVLLLASLPCRDASALEWLTTPPAAALGAACHLLQRLGAISTTRDVPPRVDALTATGELMMRLPTHPRISRLLVEAQQLGVAGPACLIAAMLSERSGVPTTASTASVSQSDVTHLAEQLELQRGGVPANLKRIEKQLLRAVDTTTPAPDDLDEALRQCILTGYPDRVGRVRRPANATGRSGREVVLSSGNAAPLDSRSVLAEDVEWVVAVDLYETQRKRQVRAASGIELDWLLERYADDIEDQSALEYNTKTGRVELVRRMTYGSLLLEESRGPAPASPESARVLVQAVRSDRKAAIVDPDRLAQLRGRLLVAGRAMRALAQVALDEDALEKRLVVAAVGCVSRDELAKVDLLDQLVASLPNELARALARDAPVRATLPGGRSVTIDYRDPEHPAIGSRLQDFFGMQTGPTVAQGRLPLLLHLLAPNQRAVQVTTDLSGFWDRHYPDIAKTLRRRYPKHAWPDDPKTAKPPAPHQGRGRR